MKPYLKRAWAEVSLGALESNIEKIKSLLHENTQIMAVIKADAYGHGEDEILKKLRECGIRYFAVSNLDEAVSVRKHCPDAEILILGFTPPEYASELEENNIIQGVLSYEYAKELDSFAKQKVRCHVKIDTGMGRIGLKYNDPSKCADEVQKIISLDKISAEGLYTHFAVADNPDDAESCEYTKNQADFIVDVYNILKERGYALRHCHFLNSAGICYHNRPESTLARAGIIMYGLYPNYPVKLPVDLKLVMSLKAVVSQVKKLHKGDSVSYGRTYKADCDGITAATVTVGYADGYSRLLSGKADVLVRGKRCPIIGRVCMDQLVLDVSDAGGVKEGDIVTLIGRDGCEEITADELASLYGTIGYEVVCGISKRVPRIYVD
ncbi:alanine racemase [Porcipelethomonas sp.]|uniref:alanine racemase n=1 Tax=Porcipelethomonas sp. TaxID=2981675 RepID=UPI003EF713F1